MKSSISSGLRVSRKLVAIQLALMEEMQKAKADNSVDHSQQATIFDAKADGETKTAAA